MNRLRMASFVLFAALIVSACSFTTKAVPTATIAPPATMAPDTEATMSPEDDATAAPEATVEAEAAATEAPTVTP
jgi:hypothetical protein